MTLFVTDLGTEKLPDEQIKLFFTLYDGYDARPFNFTIFFLRDIGASKQDRQKKKKKSEKSPQPSDRIFQIFFFFFLKPYKHTINRLEPECIQRSLLFMSFATSL